MSKAREFWLNPNSDNRGWSKGKPDQYLCDLNPHGQPIHVIEISAYEEKCRELAKCKQESADMCTVSYLYAVEKSKDEIKELRLENAKLIKELESHRRGHCVITIEKLREALAKQHKYAHDNLSGDEQWQVKYITEMALKETGGDDVTTDKTPIRSR